METTYRFREKRRGDARHDNRYRRGSKVALGIQERQRLIQLVVCTLLFFVVFIGKGIFPDKVAAVRDEVLAILQSDTDFEAAFSHLGRSFSAGEPVMETLEDLWVDVFGGGSGTPDTQMLGDTKLYRMDLDYLTRQDKADVQPVAYYIRCGELEQEQEVQSGAPQGAAQPAEVQSAAEAAPTATPVPEASAEPEVIHMDYSGPALPEHTTMDRYALGLGETVTPVLGWLSSGFGWREHPVDGGEKFHNGVDLAVNTGTEVKAFADGVVDYIGESPIYGKYLQIKHDAGVTTFYAHCNELCVQQGQSVAAGEKVAESGETGNATGPHLHFEVKRNGVRLNPIYYIDQPS